MIIDILPKINIRADLLNRAFIKRNKRLNDIFKDITPNFSIIDDYSKNGILDKFVYLLLGLEKLSIGPKLSRKLLYISFEYDCIELLELISEKRGYEISCCEKFTYLDKVFCFNVEIFTYDSVRIFKYIFGPVFTPKEILNLSNFSSWIFKHGSVKILDYLLFETKNTTNLEKFKNIIENIDFHYKEFYVTYRGIKIIKYIKEKFAIDIFDNQKFYINVLHGVGCIFNIGLDYYFNILNNKEKFVSDEHLPLLEYLLAKDERLLKTFTDNITSFIIREYNINFFKFFINKFDSSKLLPLIEWILNHYAFCNIHSVNIKYYKKIWDILCYIFNYVSEKTTDFYLYTDNSSICTNKDKSGAYFARFIDEIIYKNVSKFNYEFIVDLFDNFPHILSDKTIIKLIQIIVLHVMEYDKRKYNFDKLELQRKGFSKIKYTLISEIDTTAFLNKVCFYNGESHIDPSNFSLIRFLNIHIDLSNYPIFDNHGCTYFSINENFAKYFIEKDGRRFKVDPSLSADADKFDYRFIKILTKMPVEILSMYIDKYYDKLGELPKKLRKIIIKLLEKNHNHHTYFFFTKYSERHKYVLKNTNLTKKIDMKTNYTNYIEFAPDLGCGVKSAHFEKLKNINLIC